MWNRTLSVSSGGKTFSVTGWKTGWAIGPEHFIKVIGNYLIYYYLSISHDIIVNLILCSNPLITSTFTLFG